MKDHPQDLERVTIETVRSALGSARYRDVYEASPGVVLVEVSGWTRARRQRAQSEIHAALAPKKFDGSAFWTVRPGGMTYRRIPPRTWVGVRDAGLDYAMADGRSWIDHAEEAARTSSDPGDGAA